MKAGTLSPPGRALTEWLRGFAISNGRVSADQAKAIRAVVRSIGDRVLLRVTDGEWHAAEYFPAANAERAVMPASERCLAAVLLARDQERARRLVRDALAAAT